MTTFDSWEVAVRPPEDYLMHFRTKGSKNGVRRYQTESGEWTELGLEERRKREGFGESRKAARIQKKIARAEKKQAKREAKAQRKFEKSERKRKSKISGLTDEEMAAKLKRAKMEAEYKELTKKHHSVLETGSKVIDRVLSYKENKEMRVIDLNKQKLEVLRLETEQKKAQELTKQAKESTKKAAYDSKSNMYNAKKAQEERKQMEADVRGGLALKRKAELKRAKKEYRETTVRGAIGKFFNAKAKGAGEAAGEAKKNKVASQARRKKTDDIIRNERNTVNFNRWAAKKGGSKIDSDWTREKHNTDARNRMVTKTADFKTQQEKWKAEQEKWKTKGGR